MGAAGRDFHNFNVYFRGNKHYQVIAFTATQIPDIYGRKYPKELAGKGYEDGIPIYDESELTSIIKRDKIDLVVFSYSDVSYEYIMHKASIASAAGANFMLLGSRLTMIKSKKPVISVCAVRTGCGKSQTTRRVIEILRARGRKVTAIRHPMPYGDLVAQRVQRFANIDDLKKHNCTIEEMEEYEPHIAMNGVIYAGVDYAEILTHAEAEADIIVWDGGNNDLPFYKPDLHIVVVDPHRPGHELKYFPGETNLRMADVAVINKIDTANWEDILTVQENIHAINPHATIISAASPITVDKMGSIRGKKVLVIEDGPTLTHGEMKYGAGVIAAMKFGAEEMVDPRPFTVGSITETFKKYPEIGTLLPAMGYGKQQMRDLQETIERTKCDTVIIATPIDLRRLIHIRQESVRVGYCLQEIGKPDMEEVLKDF